MIRKPPVELGEQRAHGVAHALEHLRDHGAGAAVSAVHHHIEPLRARQPLAQHGAVVGEDRAIGGAAAGSGRERAALD